MNTSTNGRPAPSQRVTAVLGPTNTGKTHYAVTRMLAYETGMIGLPLRLLAREIYDRVVEEKGAAKVALITGEEKIAPETATYFICTVESMPVDRAVDFVAVDEVQLCADPERGHIFTDRILHARGSHETLLLGSETTRGLLKHLLGDIPVLTRSRFSELKYAGPKKVSRLPRRSAIVAFSADAVYGIAELIRRQRGGAAVVMGALSPRTRNAQVALYQSGEVDFLVATDAIGMGLNMDVDHVAFASRQKFDGRNMRALRPHEVGQIAGRAGRYTTDGTFGTTGDAGDFEPDLIEQIEMHRFDPLKAAQWRNSDLSFASIDSLIESLSAAPEDKALMRARATTDFAVLERLASEADVREGTTNEGAVRRLWQVCQIPDFRNISPEEHAQLLLSIFRTLKENGDRLPDDFMEGHIKRVDSTDGDIDALTQRIAHVRTWTFVANRAGWLDDALGWQGRAREVEDKLSDALHDSLTQRFIDRRTSVLMKRLGQDEDLSAEIDNEGEVTIEGEFVGRLHGFRFVADPRARGLDAKMVRRAADKAVRAMMAARAEALLAAPDMAFKLTDHGRIWWDGQPIARLTKGADTLSPRIWVMCDDLLDVIYRERIATRLATWVEAHVGRILTPLIALRDAATAKTASAEASPAPTDGDVDTPKADAPETEAPEKATHKPNDPRAPQPAPAVIGGAVPLTGLARGVGFQMVEGFGVLDRRQNAKDIRALEQSDRAQLRRFGVRFGEFSLFIPSMLKPSPAELLAILWGVHNERFADDPHPDAPTPALPAPGLTSVPRDKDLPSGFYSAAGFRVCGARAVRIDMLERLGQMIRAAREPETEKAPAKEEAAPATVTVEIKKKAPKHAAAKAGAPAAEMPNPEVAPDTAPEVVPETAVAQGQDLVKPTVPKGMFEASVDMMSIVGCSGEEFDGILRSLGYKTHTLRVEGGDDITVWRTMPRPSRGQKPRGKPAQSKGAPRDAKGGHKDGPRRGKGKGQGKDKPGGKGSYQSRPPRREKKLDPDSPFAVLQQLKEDLKS
jgi:ATP-dependent RNA helicase SUPV3L1/SUV3